MKLAKLEPKYLFLQVVNRPNDPMMAFSVRCGGLCWLLLLVATPPLSECGRIMFYMPFVSNSMRITYMPVVRELAARGHQVTVVTPYDSKEPDNVQMIVIKSPIDDILNEVRSYVRVCMCVRVFNEAWRQCFMPRHVYAFVFSDVAKHVGVR